MKKALFFDIDGTLVDFEGKMPESAKLALKKAQERGHLIVICSGRSVCQIYPFLIELGFDGIIAASGAYVEYKNEVIFRHRMDEETLKLTCAVLEEAHASYSAQTERVTITGEANKDRMFRRFRRRRENEDEEVFMARMNMGWEVDDNIAQRRDVEKMNFFESQIPISEIRRRLEGYCDVVAMSFNVPTDTDGEISTKGVNKALGIQKFIEHAGIAREDTVVFGDGPNDSDMLEYAHISVAMGNAREEIKKMASYVTKDINDDGIAYAMSELGLI